MFQTGRWFRRALGPLLAAAAWCVLPAHAQQGAEGWMGPEGAYEPQTSAAKGYRPGVSSWEYCAREGDRCRADGWGVVRYGDEGRYVYREFRDARFWCDNRTFGDPAPRKKKSCELRYYGGGHDDGYGHGSDYDGGYDSGYDEGYDDGWTRCANEGGICQVPGPAIVRYGARDQHVEQRVRGGAIRCDNRSFGADPARGKGKYCDYQLVDDGYGASYGGDWEYCAREGEYCEFRGRRQVRYGANGRYVVETFRGGTECTNAAFGTDPAPRRSKTCEVEVR